jgi:hypothetical protein
LVEECWLIGGGELGGGELGGAEFGWAELGGAELRWELRWAFMCDVLKVLYAVDVAIWVRRRLMKKATMLAVMPRQANPPTTPPAIAPALDFLAELMPPNTEAVGVAVLSTVVGG